MEPTNTVITVPFGKRQLYLNITNILWIISRFLFLAWAEVNQLHTTAAYTNLGITSESYKISKQYGVEMAKVMSQIWSKI
jgi:hypothetical protein